ncbi:ATP-dependent protease ClpP protease subunit [Hephaestia caeni]|uniref:ATP-dependent Clp protease proteolytic subunit n=2 Tax=Hephaestia caeni TaxID=645617 RepID=A0A397NPA1_9SPHN|nr:ATP-dependent protease ClpP protease subunit [Hephaestia caeni]
MLSMPPRVMAKARPGALPMPADRRVSAFAPASVYDRWGEDAAGVRALERGDNVITMFEDIGEDFWTGGGITAKKVAAQLRAIGDRPVEVQINSPGGDMFEGIAIYNVLREHPQDITVKVMGMAASAASLVAMAGDRVEIGVSSFIMIHNCWVMAIGNRHDMAEVAEWLAPFDQAMVDLYALRTGADAAQIAKWMDDEAWMSGSTAIERGFADALLPADQMVRDEETQASDREVNELRALELTLVRAGHSRRDARARINKIKGTPGAAPIGTPGAADPKWTGALAGLLDTLKV